MFKKISLNKKKRKTLYTNCYIYNDMVKKVTIYSALEPFLIKPREKLHLADISREINQPHPTVRQWLNYFEEKGVLNKEKKGRLTLYSLNLGNPNIFDYLVIAEKNKLIKKNEKWPVLAELVSYINNLNINAAIFGSAADSFNSANDIDILVVGKFDVKELKKFSKKLNKELHIINVNSFEKISNSLRIEVIKKHLLIKGSENFVRWMVCQQ